MSLQFWNGKRVVVTGHTGFKGSWLTLWLNSLGAKVTGISLPATTDPSLFVLANVHNHCESLFCDVRDGMALQTILKSADPEIVFHMAAQSLVRESYIRPVDTFATNIMGTVQVLESLTHLQSARVALMVTTDKVYQNKEWFWPYREDDALGGHDPYSASKAASEIVIASYRDSFLRGQEVAVASARAGNVIGGGDWSADRLIPDAVRAWSQGSTLQIRQPESIRPWQHVLEPLWGYLRLAEKIWHQPGLFGAYNFGPETRDCVTVREVIDLARASYGRGEVAYPSSVDEPHEARLLSLETAKTRTSLGVYPKWGFSDSIQRTMTWYRRQELGESAFELCMREIAEYSILK